MIASGWRVLFAAQKQGQLAATGPYRRVRHPQYAGFLLIMIGFLLQWPTFATLAMFPILVYVYRRLAIREEGEVAAVFGSAWSRYAAATPRFVPRGRASTSATPPDSSALEPVAGAQLHENRRAASRALQTHARR